MVILPRECERDLLERFLRAEAMAMYSVRSAQDVVPARILDFLKQHEREEAEHLSRFEAMTGIAAHVKQALPALPRQWHACAVHLYGYEALGFEFARLLAGVRPDLSDILEDEERHVGFFEREITRILEEGRGAARGAREYARAWLRRLPRTVDRYLSGDTLAPQRERLRKEVIGAIEEKFCRIGLIARGHRTITPSGPG